MHRNGAAARICIASIVAQLRQGWRRFAPFQALRPKRATIPNMSAPHLSLIDLAALAQFDTPTICNTIELFQVRPRTAGYMDSRIRACFPEMPPAVGYAATATMRCAFPRREGDVYGSLDEQVGRFSELPGPAIVVYQDLDDPALAATFGEIMCTTYKSFGAQALIRSEEHT